MPMSHKKNAPSQAHHSLQGFAVSQCGSPDQERPSAPSIPVEAAKDEQVKGGQLGLKRDEVGEE